MPFTPFIGLSVFVHLCVILWNKIFSSGKVIGVLIKHQSTKLMRLGVAMIMVSVFAVVLVTASSLVRAGVTDKYSTINFTEHYIGLASSMFFYSGNNFFSDNKMLLPVYASVIEKTADTCTNSASSTADYNNSLVNYLESKNQDHSFKARSYIAITYDIKNYKGSRPQNILLLQRLIDSESCRS